MNTAREVEMSIPAYNTIELIFLKSNLNIPTKTKVHCNVLDGREAEELMSCQENL